MEENRESSNTLSQTWSIDFQKRCQVIQWGENSPFNNRCLDNWINNKKMKLDPDLTPHAYITT